METLSEHEKEFILAAARFLENPGFLIKAANVLGKPLEAVQKKLPESLQKKVSAAAENALSKTLDISISTLSPDSLSEPPLQLGKKHAFATGFTGAIGGFFGPLALAMELPLTTGIIFRSIASIAQSFGEDLSDPHVRLECLQVFAMGSPQNTLDDAMNSSYFSQRLAFNAFLKNASESGMASLLARFITRVAARYEVVVAEKIMAEAIPIIGAAGGAAINVAFTNFFNNTAYYHFGLRRLERKYGTQTIQEIYLDTLRYKSP